MNENPYFLKPFSWAEPNEEEIQIITDLIGKRPQVEFTFAVRNKNGSPLVIENSPFFYDGTPMPTRYWLVDPELVAKVSRIERTGGVKQVQLEIDFETIQNIHDSHEMLRDELIAHDYVGPRPTGGVGGTRKGVKCLHTHLANYLATGDDVIGIWTLDRIESNE